jgi:predicted glutamine amidotransferase
MIGTSPADTTLDNQLVSGTYSFASLASSNPDGWSLTYFSPALAAAGLTRPQILRGGPPANNEFDHRFEDAVTEMLALDPTCAIAHIRAASSGHSDIPDPHPFRRGDMVLVHNGTFTSATLVLLLEENDPEYLAEHPPDYDDPHIDSELFFLYLRKLREEGVDSGYGTRSHAMADAISEAALRVYGEGGIRSAANCIVSEGDTLFVLRFDVNDQERYKVRYKKIPSAWIVASEPVGSDTTGWLTLPPKSLGVFLPTDDPQILTIFPPPGPWISIAETKIDDDTLGQSAGNGDGELDAGETVELTLLLSNEGAGPATSVWAQLETEDTLATISDSITTYPDIPPGDLAAPLDEFVITVSPECPLYHMINFTLTITAGTGPDLQTWEHSVTLPARAPSIFHYASLVWDGNDNHLEPGEEADLEVWLENRGGETATSLAGSLSTDFCDVEILEAQAQIDTLGLWEPDSLVPPFRIAVLPTCPDPEIITFALNLEADWGITSEITFEIPVGGFADNFEGGSGEWTHESGMPGYGDAWHMSELRNHTPTGSWSWKCGAPDSAGVYDDLLDAMLISPVVTLAENTELRFWHWICVELSSHFGEADDGGLVETSINGGPWQQIYPATGYDFVIASADVPGPFPPQTPVFAGYYTWRQAVFCIHGHTGTAQFRFRFGSDGDGGFEGWYIDDVQVLGTNTASEAPAAQELPLKPALTVGGPSPFREETLILYDVVRPGNVELTILDLEGRLVRHLTKSYRAPGRHRITWNGRDAHGRPVPSGLYFYRLRSRADGFEEVRRVIRLR